MSPACQEQKEKISAIIPILNAAHLLPPLIAQLQELGEIILADGGSTDTPQGGRIIQAQRGRGSQLAAGAAAAAGEWLLFLHADTRLEQGWEAALLTAMQQPDRAHYFRFALDDSSRQARRLEAGVAWRCRTLGLPYGDQGLFLSAALYQAVGGYSALPLMEDVEMVRRLGRKRLAPMAARAITSAERWRRDGWGWRSTRNLLTLSLYFCGVSPEWLVRFYARR